MRTIVILVVLIILLALVRLLIADVARAVSGALRSEDGAQRRKRARGGPKDGGRLVQDPETGAYVDEEIAVKADVRGRVYFFESEQSRDAYLRKQRKAG